MMLPVLFSHITYGFKWYRGLTAASIALCQCLRQILYNIIDVFNSH